MVTIRVTQDCIDNGIARNDEECPVARAIKPILKPGIGVSVNVHYREVLLETSQCTWISIFLIPEEETKILDFDNLKGMEPHSFQLDIPEKHLK